MPHGYGANDAGQWRPIGGPDVTRFTVLGALMRVSGGSKELLAMARALFKEVAPELLSKLISHVDALTHAESLHILDAAIGALWVANRYIPNESGIVSRLDESDVAKSLDALHADRIGNTRDS